MANHGGPSRLWDFKSARRHAEAKDRSMRDKTMSLSEAVRSVVKQGDHVAIGGSLYTRTPMAAVYEMIRQRPVGVSISRGLSGFETDLLVVGNGISHVISSWWSPGYAWGLSKVMRELVEGGRLRFEEWSHLAMGLRYQAAAMGLSFLPTFSMLGSSLRERDLGKEMVCPFTNEKLFLVPSLYPDVGIVHVQRADKFGNAQIEGYKFMDHDIALASRKLVITTEEVVDTETLRAAPEKTTIPFFCVDAVVKVPYGSYPGECWNRYEADFDHFSHYADLVKARGLDGVKQYLSEFVYSTDTFEQFLKVIGDETLTARSAAFENVAR